MIPAPPPSVAEGFEMRADGLYFLEEAPHRPKDEDSTPHLRARRISAPFEVLAQTRNFQSSDWGIRLRWLDPTGKPHEHTIPRDQLVFDGRSVLQILARHGLLMSGGQKAKLRLLAFLEGNRPECIGRTTRQTGWHEGLFVLPTSTFGASVEPVFYENTAPHTYEVSGTLQEWQAEVARHAESNSRLVFALSTAFAAALVGPLDLESAGFHLFGQSSRGKTCTGRVAGSVWGGPRYHVTWSATLSGLETIAFGHSDTLLVLDEEAQKIPDEADSAAFLLVSGQSKVRSTRTLEQDAPRRWRTLFLSTGESPLYTGPNHTRRSSRAGHSVRLIDVPIVPDGLDQAFESTSEFESTGHLARHLEEAVQRRYGSASHAFLEQASQMSPEAWATLKKELQTWAGKRTPPDADPQVHRVILRFALVAMGGRLAERWKVVPWPVGTSDWGVGRCLLDWLAHRGGRESGEELRVIQAVCSYLEIYGNSRFQMLERGAERPLYSSGYRRPDAEGRTDYFFHPAGWREAIGDLDPRTAAAACARAGLLRPTQDGPTLRHQRKVRTPDQGTLWLYEIPGRALEAIRSGQQSSGDEFLAEEEAG